MGVSLCTFVKNESNCIEGMINSVKQYVDEIVVVDTGSVDDTVHICKSLGARVYQVPFTDFGSIRTLTAHLGRESHIFMLDADERIELDDGHILKDLVNLDYEAYAFPRMRWLDLAMTQRTELEAWPDLQVRFFKNNVNYVFKRQLHEYFDGAPVQQVSHPIIHHFHDALKSPSRLLDREKLYKRLASAAGVTVEGGKEIK